MSLWEGFSPGRLWIWPQTSKGRGMWSNDQSMRARSGSPVQSHRADRTNNSQRNPARSDFLPAIIPATVSTLFVHHFPKRSPYLSWLRDNAQRRLSAKTDPWRSCTLFPRVTWIELLFGRTRLVNARVSSVVFSSFPCNWYNVKKLFSDRPEKTYGPCLWSEAHWVSLVYSWRRAAASCY